jgi:ribosomal protein L40E
MKAFDNRSAVEEYMSTHTLGYSTPDLTLKEFVLWLCEMVDDPNGKEENIPRIMLYLKEVEDSGKSERESSHASSANLVNTITEPKIMTDLDKQPSTTNNTESKFCIECGSKLNLRSMFCTKCGTEQAEV